MALPSEVFIRAQQGDEDAKNMIFEHYHKFACQFAWKWLRRYKDAEKDDIIGAAYEGLTKAYIRYDPTLGHEFTTYAGALIEGEIRRRLREEFRPRGYQREESPLPIVVVSLDEPVHSLPDGRNIDLLDVIEAPDEFGCCELLSVIDKAMEVVKEKYRDAVRLVIDGETQMDASRRTGVRQPTINRQLAIFKEKLRHELGMDDRMQRTGTGGN